jgi:hypothetical protein
MATRNQLVDGSFMNTAGYNAGQAPVATAPVATALVYATNPNTGYVEGGSQPFTAAQTTTTPPPPAPTPAASATPAVPAGFTQAQVDAQIAAAIATTQNQDIANAAANKAASISNAATQSAAVLSGYGLTGDIANGLVAMMQNGLDMTTITNILDSSNPSATVQNLGLSSSQLASANSLVTSWQARFVGNQTRIANGLKPLDPATYIANEQSYKQVMTMAGIPASSPLQSTSYLGNLMAQDVSPAEVASRVSTATSAIQNEDPAVIAQLQSQFGLSQSTLVSHLLDPAVSAPVVAQEYQAATIAAEAARSGVAITVGNTNGSLPASGILNNNSLQMQLAAQGVSQAQAAAGFQTIAQQQPALQSIAGRYGAGVVNPANIGSTLQADVFNTNVNGTSAAQASQQLNLLKTAETSAFSGSAGAATGSLGLRDTSGLQ